ncbi:MAG: amino acid synthesis family protein, partial [Candidatus Binataceae bacterium]
GVPLDIPLAYKDALFVRSHYDTATIRIADAPRPDELVVAVAVATGPRIHHRVGGLARESATKGDGLR